jgi:hypothetical protein
MKQIWNKTLGFVPVLLGQSLPWIALAFLLLVTSVTSTALAQQTNATIVGNITDTSGAVVVGATVNATNKSTNTVRTTVTDGSGQYSLPSLPPGVYSLSVGLTGFQGQRIESLILQASQTAHQDFNVAIGKVSETITVESGAAAAQLQTENGAVGAVIDAKKIVDLPLNGRNFVQLAQLLPGVNSGTEGSITVRRARDRWFDFDSSERTARHPE